jgi:hypothetical protein
MDDLLELIVSWILADLITGLVEYLFGWAGLVLLALVCVILLLHGGF